MRALCAAIVTAGSLIGLGLTALGLGVRYQGVGTSNPSQIIYVRLSQLDTAMMLILAILLSMVLIGVVTTFVGLAYHHERRHYERHGKPSESLGAQLGR